MWSFVVDSEKCVKCGRCVRECSRFCLVMSDNGPVPTADAAEKCFHCQHCLCVCPTGAVAIEGVTAAECPPAAPIPSPDEMLNLIRVRRSCRIFRPEPLPEETLATLRSMLAWTPTGCNARSLQFLMVENPATMDELREKSRSGLLAAFDRDPVPPAAAKFARMKPMLERNINPIFRNAPHMLAVALPEDTPCPTMDPIIALSYFELYCQTLGVGTLWCGLAYWLEEFMPELFDRIGRTPGFRLGYVMLFGRPEWGFARGAVRELAAPLLVRS